MSSRASQSNRSSYRNTINDSDSVSDVSDDDQTFGAAEDQPQIFADDSLSLVTAATASTGASRGLPLNLKKQFVVDIQAAGGLDSRKFSFAAIAAEKPILYGTPGSKKYRQFENQAQRWKGKQRDSYNDLATSSSDNNTQPAIFQSPERAKKTQSVTQRPATAPRLHSAQPAAYLPPRSPPSVHRTAHPATQSPRPFNSRPSIMASNSFLTTLFNHANSKKFLL